MAKCDELQKTCKSVALAEKQMNMLHIIKANALKRSCVEMESEVAKKMRLCWH